MKKGTRSKAVRKPTRAAQALDEAETNVDAMFKASLGDTLKTLRRASGLTMDALSRAAGVGRMTVVRYEQGRVAKIIEALKMIDAIETALASKNQPDLMASVARLRSALVRKQNIDAQESVRQTPTASPSMLWKSSDHPGLSELVELFFRLEPPDRKELVDFVRGFVSGRARGPAGSLTK